MPVDLDKIRALLAPTSGAAGPWRLVDVGDDTGRVRILDADNEDVIYIGDNGRWEALELDLISAAPDLHRGLTEAVGEIERLRAHNARMVDALVKMAHECKRRALLMPECNDRTTLLEADDEFRRLAAGEVDDG